MNSRRFMRDMGSLPTHVQPVSRTALQLRQYRRKVSAMAAAERDGNVWFQFRTNKAVSLSAAR
jgi:hypothetical protein